MAKPQYVTWEEFGHHFNLLKDANLLAMKCLATAVGKQIDPTQLRVDLEGFAGDVDVPGHSQLLELIKINLAMLIEGAEHAERLKAAAGKPIGTAH